ncbi:hypothetical protein F7734_14540 [Scytonema sp. UIC 10036]|uniref:SDH family Clp fold serine proteinase n=1 Tax=Scytonema sp. UIC 10036 TaxID=2304196 RepID=UPI0012DAB8E3|nr:ATP-dependent Clp protease proteolytic subunit [Scytonema sp. UIC 10036]MUG93576.1 hypothetical protein [Scytonema sp. UIC 10036]
MFLEEKESIQKYLQQVSQDLDADMFVFYSRIDYRNAHSLIEKIRNISDKKTNIALIVETGGGDANAAFKIASFLKRKYQKIILLVFGGCKSAGTLLAIAADEIVMSDFGELGPLDIQVWKEGDIKYESSLDIKQSLAVIREQAEEMFKHCLFSIINLSMSNGDFITLKTAEEIAQSIAIGLLTPVSGQINSLRLGELDRLTKVAEEYGKRLNSAREELVKQLISDYPSHDFVIGYEEVRQIFQEQSFGQNSTVVRQPKEAEEYLERFLDKYLRQTFVGTLKELVETNFEDEGNRNSNSSIQQNT